MHDFIMTLWGYDPNFTDEETEGVERLSKSPEDTQTSNQYIWDRNGNPPAKPTLNFSTIADFLQTAS